MPKQAARKVFITSKEAKCDECGEDLGHKAWITVGEGGRAHCLACAELDHLEFLHAGDSALTRRSQRYSAQVAVVLKWRYISLASICGSVVFPIALVIGIGAIPTWQAASLWPLLIAATVIPLMVIVRHRENVKRLLAGTESKIRSRSDSRGGDQA